MNVVIWARVSSREQKDGYSIDAQLRATRERVAKNGWTVAREFVVAESAKRGAERLAFNEMFKWVKANAKRLKIQAILSHKLDRVCRNMRDAVRLQELEDVCGVQLAFVDNQFGPGAAGALSFNVMAAVAQYYSDNLRAETLKGMDERVKQGWPPGHAPFGYDNVDDKAEPVKPHPTQVKALMRIFELYATGRYTFESLADQLAKEGHVYRPSHPRFLRTGLSYILGNRFYVGELERNGKVYQGKYRLVIDRRVFNTCQDILEGKNRRFSDARHAFSGGLIRCACCGFALTGERIRRKLTGGNVREHMYYRCANNDRPDAHPVVRWREESIEQAILADLGTMRFPTDDMANWFRDAIRASFDNLGEVTRHQRQSLARRRMELKNMNDRLLNGYLSGAIEEAVMQAKQEELKRQLAEVEQSLDSAKDVAPDAPERALSLFDFSQRLVESWHGSNSALKREILEVVSLNRHANDVTLVVEKRKPFDFLAERPLLQDGSGGRI